jgi:hypothetical protein
LHSPGRPVEKDRDAQIKLDSSIAYKGNNILR